MRRFTRQQNFLALSIRDLIEARDLFHVHLANLEHVVATAIGRYLIRDQDPDAKDPERKAEPGTSGPRTLENSSVRPWSWPCILVFVSEWSDNAEICRDPSQLVPPRVYLPDGRIVPICVVLAPPVEVEERPITGLAFPTGLLGGGLPLLTDEQEQERIGSAGCLVTDGSTISALTSGHVVGRPRTPAYTVNRGRRVRVGLAGRKALGRVPFEDVYPGWKLARCLINLDAGLLDVDDLNEWTAQVYGVGRMGELIDLNVDTLDLSLIGTPVRAFGAASGHLRGELQAFFFRYDSVGGFDRVAELLIGQRKGGPALTTRPGDSGTIWFWDHEVEEEQKQTLQAPAPEDAKTRAFRPIAIQWGGELLASDSSGRTRPFALASSLASVCRHLEVELVRGWATDHNEYWGKVGHYKIALAACFLARDPKLDQLLRINAGNLSVSDVDLKNGVLPVAGQSFIPLADVPDLVWRSTRPRDAGNHFADLDEPGGANVGGRTLMKMWFDSAANRTPQKWTRFYDGIGHPVQNRHRGALPFRVRQLFDVMVQALRDGQLARYVAAAGVLAHYVGDACQPLHVSRLHHGDPDNPEDDAVHETYETRMLDRFAVEVVDGMNAALQGKKTATTLASGAAAAHHVVKLMRSTVQRLAPERVLELFNQFTGSQRTREMWLQLGAATLQNMAAGALCLAELWESAWKKGQGGSLVPQGGPTAPIPQATLRTLYNDPTFAPSAWLKDMSF
jgi:hypothetical protein